MKNLTLYLLIMLLVATGILSARLYQQQMALKTVKEDLIELSKVKYGLFSVDEWKRLLATIISKKMAEFNFEGENREKIRKEISAFLYKQIGDLEQRYHAERSKSFIGFMQSGIASITGTFAEIKKNIPRFTDEIINFMNDPRNRRAIKDYVITKLNEYTDKTFSAIDYETHDDILKRHGYKTRNEALTGLSDKVEVLKDTSRPVAIALLILAGGTGVVLMASQTLTRTHYLIVTLICVVLLATGLLLPMIEIDARIANMTFTLLGEPVIFQDQVLYYKSKSILEVVSMMFTQRRVDLILVGILVVSFSVLFPLLKLTASVLLLYVNRLRSNKFIQFMVFRTGKWSMADVMVIAIFMSYIGFSGIITEQLKQIKTLTENIDILTTNKSSLQTGFFAFTAFSVISLLVSHKLQYAFMPRQGIATD